MRGPVMEDARRMREMKALTAVREGFPGRNGARRFP